MGSSETKFAYQKCAYELRETVVPADNAEFWNKFWTLAQTVEDVFAVCNGPFIWRILTARQVLNPDDVREVRKKNPQNLVTLLQKVSEYFPTVFSYSNTCLKAVAVMAAVEKAREKATAKEHALVNIV
jgi:hypothetical protein